MAGHNLEKEVLQDPGALRIGIQIRVGDDRSSEYLEYHTDMSQKFFQCAEAIEAVRALPNQTVVRYLITDSLPLRQMAIQKYGEKVLTRLDKDIHHTSADSSLQDNIKQLCNVVAEHWLFGLTDYQVTPLLAVGNSYPELLCAFVFFVQHDVHIVRCRHVVRFVCDCPKLCTQFLHPCLGKPSHQPALAGQMW